jgi:hypothetical protein
MSYNINVMPPARRPRPPSAGGVFWGAFFFGPFWYWGARSAARRARAYGYDSDRYWRMWAAGWITGSAIAVVAAFLMPLLITAILVSSAKPSIDYSLGTSGSRPYSGTGSGDHGLSSGPGGYGSQYLPQTTTLEPETPAGTQSSASASCVSPPGQDSAGNPFDYGADKAIDNQTDTAWRCGHDGVGQTLTINLSRTTTLTGIGLIPGFAKVDPYDGTDRFYQSRRVSSVQYTLSDGTTINQNFDIADREVQFVSFPSHSTTSVTVTILASVPGSEINGKGAVDKVAISEVRFR